MPETILVTMLLVIVSCPYCVGLPVVTHKIKMSKEDLVLRVELVTDDTDGPPQALSIDSNGDENHIDLLSPPASWLKRSSNEKVNLAIASPLSSRKVPHHTATLPMIDVSHDEQENGEDDVFIDKVPEDTKLVDWVTNVFIPACKNLLDQCSEYPVVITKVQTYLRLLNNTIMFFCNEHQSPVVSPSRSMSGNSIIALLCGNNLVLFVPIQKIIVDKIFVLAKSYLLLSITLALIIVCGI